WEPAAPALLASLLLPALASELPDASSARVLDERSLTSSISVALRMIAVVRRPVSGAGPVELGKVEDEPVLATVPAALGERAAHAVVTTAALEGGVPGFVGVTSIAWLDAAGALLALEVGETETKRDPAGPGLVQRFVPSH